MLAVSAAALGVDMSLTGVVDSVSGVDRKPTPILLLPVDGRAATALPSDIEERWLSSAPSGTGRGSGRQSATATRRVDDPSYRYRRQRNNEAAKRSREKRRRQDGVIRHQLEALAAENRELRCQLALFRRLLDEVAARTLAPPYLKDGGSGGGVLRPGWSTSSISSSAAVSTASDQSHHDDVTEREELKQSDDERVELVQSTDAGEAVDWEPHQLLTPLNLSQRVASS